MVSVCAGGVTVSFHSVETFRDGSETKQIIACPKKKKKRLRPPTLTDTFSFVILQCVSVGDTQVAHVFVVK